MITRDTLISELLIKKPAAAQLLMSYGMGCLGCPSSQLESIEAACEIHGMPLDELLVKINKL